MDSLLCNEVWPMSPNVQESDEYGCNSRRECVALLSGDQDWQEAFRVFVNKEARYLPEPDYLKLLQTDNFVHHSRFKAVSWLVKSQNRLNLTPGTVFLAVSYLDRYISLSQCQGWKNWMFELLSVACLSVASKFNESTALPLCEFQMEGLDHFFAPNLIQWMELTLLKGLEWRMDSTTPFSYVKFLIQSIDFCSLSKALFEDLTDRVTELLISSILDPKFLEFLPCIIAISAVRCAFAELLLEPTNNASLLAFLDTVIPQEQKDFLIKCQKSIGKLQDYSILTSGPSSPVTVLLEWQLNFDDCRAELSLLNMGLRSSRKRKKEDLEKLGSELKINYSHRSGDSNAVLVSKTRDTSSSRLSLEHHKFF